MISLSFSRQAGLLVLLGLLTACGGTQAPTADIDRNGIPDSVDRCPQEPKDVDGIEDDGCPDLKPVVDEEPVEVYPTAECLPPAHPEELEAGLCEDSPAVMPAPKPEPDPNSPCTYRSYAWDVILKKGVGHKKITKTRGEVTDHERNPDDPDCSVCSEDQTTLEIEGIPKITVCNKYAPQIEQALITIRDSGEFQIRALKGYRPGKTRGAVVGTLRSEWSNHSFGTAIDINARENGLYRRCRLDGPPTRAQDIRHCKLGVGGAWDPTRRPKQTILSGGIVHRAFAPFWKWGGELPGQLKDFMHFSITGE